MEEIGFSAFASETAGCALATRTIAMIAKELTFISIPSDDLLNANRKIGLLAI